MNVRVNIDRLIKLFSENDYILTRDNINDLEHRLTTKPYSLYYLAIDFCKKRNQSINYNEIRDLIRLDIRIRDNVKKVIAAFEEHIWCEYVGKLEENGEVINISKQMSKTSLRKIIKQTKNPLFTPIRLIRDDVSHLTYFLIYGKFDALINGLKEIKKIDFIKNSSINKLIDNITCLSDNLSIKWIKEYMKKIIDDNV